jgi:hypothetical protein
MIKFKKKKNFFMNLKVAAFDFYALKKDFGLNLKNQSFPQRKHNAFII